MFKRILLGFLIVLVLPEFALANCDGTGPCYCYGAVCTNTPPPNNSNSSGNSDYDNGAAVRRAQAAEAARRAEEQRRREAELEQQRINAENKRRMEEMANQAKFIDDRNAAASTLRGSTGATSGGSSDSLLRGSTGTGATSNAPMLRGSSGDTGLRGLKSDTAHAPNLDPMVVDARHVPSGLPKSVDDAIVSGYSSAPPGVSDRVRKGFQAVATHDWKIARAWFQDTLNHDPNNAGLKRLVELADYTEKHIKRGNTGKPSHASSQPTPVQLPEDSDIQYLFPDLKPAQTNLSSATAGTATPIRHFDPTLDLLFPGLPAIEAKKLNDYMFDQAIKMTGNDPVLIKASNRLGYKQPKIPVN
jgi:hypothetical protein